MAKLIEVAYTEIVCPEPTCRFRYFIPFEPMFGSKKRKASPRFEDIPGFQRGVVPIAMLAMLRAHVRATHHAA